MSQNPPQLRNAGEAAQTVVRAVPAHPRSGATSRLGPGARRIGGRPTRHPIAGSLTRRTEAATGLTGGRVERQLPRGSGRDSRNTNGHQRSRGRGDRGLSAPCATLAGSRLRDSCNETEGPSHLPPPGITAQVWNGFLVVYRHGPGACRRTWLVRRGGLATLVYVSLARWLIRETGLAPRTVTRHVLRQLARPRRRRRPPPSAQSPARPPPVKGPLRRSAPLTASPQT